MRTEGGLSFLGLAIAPPAPSWGHPWITTFSRQAIMVAVPASNPVSDELRDQLDPRQRRRAQ